jgi:hypothetical protein
MWRPAIATIRVLLRESAVPFLQSRNFTAAGTRGINASQGGTADVRRLTPVRRSRGSTPDYRDQNKIRRHFSCQIGASVVSRL